LKLVGQPELFEPASLRALQEDAKEEGITITAMPDYGPRRPAFELLGNGDVLINIEALILRRAAVRCYLERSGMDAARRLLREWFPEPAAIPGEIAAASAAIASRMDRAGARVAPLSHDQSGEPVGSSDDKQTNRAATQSYEPERPPGVTDYEWSTYCAAKQQMSNFEEEHGGVSKVARMIADARGDRAKRESIRRALTRVRKALSKN